MEGGGGRGAGGFEFRAETCTFELDRSHTFFLLTAISSHWDFSHGTFGLHSLGKASCDRVALPNLRCMLGVLVFPLTTGRVCTAS